MSLCRSNKDGTSKLVPIRPRKVLPELVTLQYRRRCWPLECAMITCTSYSSYRLATHGLPAFRACTGPRTNHRVCRTQACPCRDTRPVASPPSTSNLLRTCNVPRLMRSRRQGRGSTCARKCFCRPLRFKKLELLERGIVNKPRCRQAEQHLR